MLKENKLEGIITTTSRIQAQVPAEGSSFVRQAAIRRKTRKRTCKPSPPPPSLVPSVAELCRFFKKRGEVLPSSDEIDASDAVVVHADNNSYVANVNTAVTATVATAGATVATVFTAANFTTVAPVDVGGTSGGSPIFPVLRNYGIPTSDGRRCQVHVRTTEAALYGPMANTVIVSMDPKKKKIRIDAGSGNLLLSVNNRSSTNDYILQHFLINSFLINSVSLYVIFRE